MPVPDAFPPAAIGGPPAAPDPVLSALADPEAWLASALADLDRIWGRRPDDPDGTARDEDGTTEPPEVAEPPSGCVVVLDLARGGERLPAGDAAPTVRRVARRLAQRLPESAHLRRDSPDALSVLLAGDDRAAAAEWMHRVVPALVDGLAVDAVVEGAHLRAAVHDAQGVVGAQVLQRLDGVRSRTPLGGNPGGARHAAPGVPAPDEDASDDPVPAVPVVEHALGDTPGGSAPDRTPRRAEDRAVSGTRPAAGFGPATGWATNGWAASSQDADDTRRPHDRDAALDASALDASAPDAPADYAPAHDASARPDSGSRNPVGDAPGPTDGSGPASVPPSEPPAPGWGSEGRHDEAGGRRPYLPDGVVVRPGTGGRRHRRNPDPVPEEPTKESTPVGPQSTEGLGLADLLAGALAAYRGI